MLRPCRAMICRSNPGRLTGNLKRRAGGALVLFYKYRLTQLRVHEGDAGQVGALELAAVLIGEGLELLKGVGNGKVLDALDRTGGWDNTVIIFVGDHGYHLGERGWWNKSTLFELSARAPLVVYAPRAKGNGKTARGIVEFVDISPTLIEMTGLTAPHKLAGTTLTPLLDNPDRAGKQFAYTVVTRGNTLG